LLKPYNSQGDSEVNLGLQTPEIGLPDPTRLQQQPLLVGLMKMIFIVRFSLDMLCFILWMIFLLFWFIVLTVASSNVLFIIYLLSILYDL
jgi:hypothetical protein